MSDSKTVPLEGLDDAELVARFSATADDTCFFLLHDRYVNKVFRRCLTFSRNPADAEDLTQEIFVKVFLSLQRYRGAASFSTWLYRIATNHCLNFLRDRKEFVELEQSAGAERERVRGAGPESVRDLLDGMPRGLQALLLLKFRDGYTYEEIATRTGLSESAVKMRISRVREQLRDKR